MDIQLSNSILNICKLHSRQPLRVRMVGEDTKASLLVSHLKGTGHAMLYSFHCLALPQLTHLCYLKSNLTFIYYTGSKVIIQTKSSSVRPCASRVL